MEILEWVRPYGRRDYKEMEMDPNDEHFFEFFGITPEVEDCDQFFNLTADIFGMFDGFEIDEEVLDEFFDQSAFDAYTISQTVTPSAFSKLQEDCVRLYHKLYKEMVK